MILWFFAFFSLFAVNAYAALVDAPIENVFPITGFSEGWVMEGKVKTFNPDNLYKHINGEAELYLPYGFETLGTALYMNKDNPDKALAVDIYRMGSLLDAFGIFSRYRDPDAAEAKIGDGSFVNDSQLMFYKDRYFVQFSASGSITPERNVYTDCARIIARNITGESLSPKELAFLNIPALIPQTETYISQSVLGYAFFKKGLTARATINGESVRVFVIFGESEKDALDIVTRYVDYLKGTGVEPRFKKDAKNINILALDPLYKGFVIRQYGRYLIGVANLANPAEGIPFIEQIQSRITE
ncbi:MAG: hypothetical protein NT178_06680 [Proteobacteria bacterium]|nr:hypothetical protein [Pseudomonadota bacterium]